jgi:hypothetical protein
MYCAALLTTGNTRIDNVGQIVAAGAYVPYFEGDYRANIAISGLRALSSYVTYCYFETAQGVGNNLATVRATRELHTTACCKTIAFTSAPSVLYGDPNKYSPDQASRYVFSYALSNAPGGDLLVTPAINTTAGILVPLNVISISPPSKRYSASSASLESSFILTVNASVFATGNFVLYLQLSDVSSAQYFSVATSVRILSANEPPSPPQLQSAVFATDGSSVTITFDSATDHSTAAGAAVCSETFAFPGAAHATCRWTSNAVVLVTFAAYDGTVPYAQPGDMLTLHPGAVKAKCDVGADCSAYVSNPEQQLVIAAPASPVKPNVVVSLPSRVAYCANITIDASLSSGHGGRDWHSVSWVVRANVPGTSTQALEDLLNSLGTSLKQSVYFQAQKYTLPGVEYTISMTAVNFLGERGSVTTQFQLSSNPNLPTVQVLGSSYFSVSPTTALTVYTSSSKSVCAEREVTFSSSWKIYLITGELTSIQTESKDPAVLLLSPRKLAAGSRYRAEVTTVASATANNPSVSATASAIISVQNGNVVAMISGGERRLVLADDVVFVDASSSYDENTGSGALLRYAWTCTYLTAARYGSSCDSVIVAGTQANRRLSVHGLQLDPAETYSFTVAAISTDGRTGTKSTTLQVQDPSSSTRVYVDDPPMKVNANNRLVLTATLSAQYALNAAWTASIGGTSFAFTSATPPAVSFSGVDTLAGIQYTLLIPGNVLSAGSTVTFRLSADRAGAVSSVYQSYSEVSVVVNAPPTSGIFSVSPSHGEALSTLFTMAATGWTDSPEDLPLSFAFAYGTSVEGGQLALQSRQGTNTATAELPAGKVSLDFVVLLYGSIYDSMLASTAAERAVVVREVASDALSGYVDNSLNTFAATQDTSQATRLINNVVSTINTVNCSATSALYCASRNRRPCLSEPNKCSDCLAGFHGVVGPSNAKCLPATRRRLSEENTFVGGSCASGDDCLLGYCVEGACAVPAKLCPTSLLDSTCSGNGDCVYSDNTGKALDTVCTIFDTQCFATCSCRNGTAGYDCSQTTEQVLALDATRRSMCETFLQVSALSNPSAEVLDTFVGSLSAVYDPAQVVTNDTAVLCGRALTVLTQLAADGLLVGTAPVTTAKLVSLTGKFAKVANGTSTAAGGVSVNDAIAQVSLGILTSMVNGQSDITVASDQVRFTATKTQSSVITGLSPPQTAEETAYGVASTAGMELVGDTGSVCDSGLGYVDISLTQWGINPFPNASALDAPQLKFESKIPAEEGARRRRLRAAAVASPAAATNAPSYYITLQYNQPVHTVGAVGDSNADATNVTFPQCTTYDAASGLYKPCDGCEVSFYSNTNVTFACYDPTRLCSSANAVSLEDMRRRLGNDDYADDAAGFGQQTSVTSIQYSALLDTLSSVLGQNPFNINFQQAKVIIAVVACLFGVFFLGFFYFRKWDIHDHNDFLYKYKEPPHLRVAGLAKDKARHDKSSFFGSLYGSFFYGTQPATPAPTPPPRALAAKESFWGDLVTVKETTASVFTFGDDVFSPASMSFKDTNPADTTNKRFGSRKASRKRLAQSNVGSYYETFADDAEDFKEQEFFQAVISNYIRTVLPIKNLDGKTLSLWNKTKAILSTHPLSTLLFSPSLQITRVHRWTMLCIYVLTNMFVDTLFFSTFYPDAGVCESYTAEADCVTPQNNALSTPLCTWTADASLQDGGSCGATPPPSDMMFTMILVMLTIIISVPMSFLFDFVMTTYCAKRPDFKKWGYNTEAILGRSTQSLGEFNRDKLTAPIVGLRHEVEAGRAATGVSARFHSEQYQAAPHKSAAERELDDIQEEARGVYDEFTSVSAEVDQILSDVITFLTVTLRNQNVPWRTHTELGVNASTALQLNAEKIKAIEKHLGVYADGTPVPLTIWEYLQFGSARAKLEAKIEAAREKEGDIVGMLEELGDQELLSKDEALTQFFVLEQFSAFKQYALSSQLFNFAVTTALPVDPLHWILAWAFIFGSLLFFLYWTLMWGVSTDGSTIEAWGINFAISVIQDLFLVQVFRLYVLYMISAITIKPQLTAIYNTLQRLAIEYVQDELPDAFGVIRVVQHVSPACRVAKLKIAESLAAGQILRHIDDRDISNFRTASSLKLPVVFFAVVAIPVIIGLVSEAAGDIMLDTVLPSAFSMLILAHYFLWQLSPLLVIVPYALLVVFVFTRRQLYTAAERRVLIMRKRLQQRRELKTLAGWHQRAGLTFDPNESFLQSVRRYLNDLQRRYQICWADTVAGTALLLGKYKELPSYVWTKLFTAPQKEHAKMQWRTFNMPAQLHGAIINGPDAMCNEQRASAGSAQPTLPAAVQAMTKNVAALWELQDGADVETEGGDACTDIANGYMLSLLGMEHLSLTYPTRMSAAEAAVEVGTVLSVGWQSYAHAPICSPNANQFRDKYGYCRSSKRALARVIGSYRQQMIEGICLITPIF